ncbi:MAG TPA: GWxTD domain-containing protein [Candidatus Acidoferrales bacterium]|nr:GWxTD domain-containing protein [Candidatus Acidoferrales bacterium]
MSLVVSNALAWALVHFLWEGAALAFFLLFFTRASARVRYCAACAALFAMPLAFAVTFLRLWQPPVASAAHRLVPQLTAVPGLGAATNDWASPAGPLWSWLVPLWITGVMVFYMRSFGGWCAARRLRVRGVAMPAAAWQERLRGLHAQIGVRRPVSILESCLAEVPVVIGYLRPVILLPAGLATGLTTDQVEALLIHELAHIRRHDYLVNLLQTAVEGLLFYHPAVWWVSHVIRTEREHCCDDAVVALRGDARRYAAALTILEAMRAPQAVLAATGGSLVHRVRRLLRQPEGPQTSLVPAVCAAILLLGAMSFLPAWQQQAPPEPALKEGSAEARGPYQKWLTEDVAYIITSEERSGFKRLQTDAERERFIEQFWLRRDPTPGTPENEFKEEHYRRIAYANDRFSDPDLAGWKTDRGRVYIVYGPPDEKESHPAVNPPNEQWLYHHIEGVGENVVVEFVDEGGHMRMTSDPHGAPPKR